jgi:D-tyrosyl-tRNA(Tyr) deacylase
MDTMKIIIQRVTEASVSIEENVVGRIGAGYMILAGIREGGTEKETVQMAEKVANIRIMPDAERKMNLSILESKGAILAISQFTLYADAKGRRPGFTDAARPEAAEPLFKKFVEALRQKGVSVETGVFGADMQVSLVNDGPVTIILESANGALSS